MADKKMDNRILNNALSDEDLKNVTGGCDSNDCKYYIDIDFCLNCGACEEYCPVKCIDWESSVIGPECTGCGACAGSCPTGAIMTR